MDLPSAITWPAYTHSLSLSLAITFRVSSSRDRRDRRIIRSFIHGSRWIDLFLEQQMARVQASTLETKDRVLGIASRWRDKLFDDSFLD